MRASRLLTILMTLQARGQTTAPVLAKECGVSLRTVYRDIETLSALGIPVYSERGAEGGYRLLDGYRTRLNGLSSQEAEALFLTGLSGPANDMGLGAAVSAAQTKLLAALPQEMRSGAERMQSRFHLDAPAWFAESEHPDLLRDITQAVWEQRTIEMRYQSWKGEKQRRAEPLGVVLKSGSWYLVAQVDGDLRTYRISRIQELSVSTTRFERPVEFDLAAYWRANTLRLEEELHTYVAEVRLSEKGVWMMDALNSPYVRAATLLDSTPDAQGWRKAKLPVGALRQACVELLRFGADLEVLEPPELREKMASIAEEMAQLYAQSK
ncbi:helix-turn-helix transcriptional regulator [Hahella sp. NBU794]|uniref:helix-turn-helix transcriptional regulator n=1 Tax=Hahella sp. NBU794 TaxID=3422590 RepID=UPI003D6FF038